ncbi:DUF72 domain-containing protein [Cellulomonas chengniuliangii]|uniref:DUF72 domain-containing protein n=1 Tax=Cellulomonas chengniuliangii TaxID=2968084 RepID=UPI001D0EA66D|nr:DUF72 domain-containing protein [Cellulomonas chengniuliangii]MCC2317341.1 DUF72 domain-containing protein [Cellulomonas chengniuliangii]
MGIQKTGPGRPTITARPRVGISGWNYAPWRGAFYPQGMPHRHELAYAAQRLGSIEVNGSFYALQRPASYLAWAEQTPEDFTFSVKGGRFITHMKRLVDVDVPLANFFASGVLALGSRLGPVLWQLPPSLPYEPERIAGFLRLLPRSTAEAARLAERHDERLDGRALTTTDADRPVRHALEARHASYAVPEFVEQLREHDVALVVADSPGRWPALFDVTADFVYVRLHGDTELYASGYTDDALDLWAGRVRGWRAGDGDVGAPLLTTAAPHRPEGRDVFVYFDNDAKAHAPHDAIALARRLDAAGSA